MHWNTSYELKTLRPTFTYHIWTRQQLF